MAKQNGHLVLSQTEAPLEESLGLRDASVLGLVKAIQNGLRYSKLLHFQRRSQLPLGVLAKTLHIPPRTLARRRAAETLSPDESERLLRLARLYEKALGLFEGDTAATAEWLQAPSRALAGRTPLTWAETEIGTRAVEDLIGRLEYGVYS